LSLLKAGKFYEREVNLAFKTLNMALTKQTIMHEKAVTFARRNNNSSRKKQYCYGNNS